MQDIHQFINIRRSCLWQKLSTILITSTTVWTNFYFPGLLIAIKVCMMPFYLFAGPDVVLRLGRTWIFVWKRSVLEMIELSVSSVWIILILCLNQPGHKSMTTRRYTLRPVNTPPLPNTLRPRQNGRHFPDNIFKCIFLMKMFEFQLTFYCRLFLRVQLTIFHHWFR